MKKKIQSFLYLLPSIIFNITETLVIFLIGISLKLDIKEVLIVMLTFGIVRMVTRSGLHYKSWKECFVWSALQLLSLFLTIKTGLMAGINHPNYNSKLSLDDVKYIRDNYNKNDRNNNITAFAKKYNMHRNTISKVINRKTYKYI